MRCSGYSRPVSCDGGCAMPLVDTALASVRSLHRFLSGRSFYALALASVLACTLLALRVWRMHTWGYAWLTWNLILAWVPYLASRSEEHTSELQSLTNLVCRLL